MKEGNPAMAYNATSFAHSFMDPDCIPADRISGPRGLAIRLGQALENWGREVSKPVDREAQRRDFERQIGNEVRMLQAERLVRRHW